MGIRTRTERYQLADTAVWRVGYGAMRLAGPGVFGPPDDHDEAIAVLRAAVGAGVDHIDTSHYYGPAVVNELIREALSPYPDSLALVSKVGGRREVTMPHPRRSRWHGCSRSPTTCC
jgi:pyridoxine 4-dehydrogenase